MTQQEYEKAKRECWEEFNDIVRFQTHPSDPMNAFGAAFDRAYTLGKQEKNADTVMQGWVCRDEDEGLFLYEDKPIREDGRAYCKPSVWVGEVITRLDGEIIPRPHMG